MTNADHIPEPDRELYSLGRLPEGKVPVEEHLLVCEECRVRLKAEDDYHAAIKAALRKPTAGDSA